MNYPPRSPRPQVLLGIALSFVAVVLVVWKLNSATISEADVVNPSAVQISARMPTPSDVSKDRVRKIHVPSADLPPILSESSIAASFVQQDALPPASSTPSETAAFLVTREKLMRSRQQLMQGLADSAPEERHKAMEKWHKENAEALGAQQQLAIRMGAESRLPRVLIQEPRIPDNATPELREFLTTRHALMKDRAEMMNQLRDATPEEQQNTMKAWHESYSERLAALRSLASKTSLSVSPSHNP